MAIFAYMLAAAHVILLPATLRARANKIRLSISVMMLALAALYFTLASYHPELLPLVIVAEVVALIRFLAHNARLSLGTGSSQSLSRHTERVLLKSINASIFTVALTSGLLALCIQFTWAVQALLAWPTALALEYFLRSRRARRIAATLTKPEH